MKPAARENSNRFLDSLRESRHDGSVPVIAEIKVFTPKNGDLMRGRSVESIAEQYERSGMACLSVVTGRWFQGTPQLLLRASQTSRLPILRKDFIVSQSALERSRELGASAVLLTRRLVAATALKKLADHTLCLGMTPFIEVGSAEEIEATRVDQEAILAVCNRDIKTRETDSGDITNSLALLDAAKTMGAGLVVSASAIENGGQARRLLEAGFDALLIGTALLEAPDLCRVLTEFRVALTNRLA
ncbi:MAG: hypothetical protein ACRERU_11810 [Methylococcales bacterium]